MVQVTGASISTMAVEMVLLLSFKLADVHLDIVLKSTGVRTELYSGVSQRGIQR